MAAQIPVEFDPIRKQIFIENLQLRLSPVDAAKAAGFTTNLARVAKALLADEDVQAQIESYRQQLAQKYDTSKDAMLHVLVDAIDIARVQADPKGMVMAVKEVNEMHGHHAPKQVNVEQTHKTPAQIKHKMRQIPDAQLLELAEEADFTPVELLPHDE
jgi:hypothetical protein